LARVLVAPVNCLVSLEKKNRRKKEKEKKEKKRRSLKQDFHFIVSFKKNFFKVFSDYYYS